MKKPDLFITISDDDKGEIENVTIEKFPEFYKAIGEELLIAFSRCFIHIDRLISLIDFYSENIERKSPRHRRNSYTIIWFMIGTLHELREASIDLSRYFRAHPKLKLKPKDQLKLKEYHKRWDNKKTFRNFRNKVVSHVDTDVIQTGLNELVKSKKNYIWLESSKNSKLIDSLHLLGEEALLCGVGIEDSEMKNFLEEVAQDLDVVTFYEELFIEASRQIGVEFREK